MKNIIKKILLVFVAITYGLAQNPANLDTTFGTSGKVFTDFNSNSEIGNSMVIQPDGKIILAGTGLVTSANAYNFCVARYNTNGTLDTSFGTNGKANFEITNYNNSYKRDYATGIALQSDGKIVISGYCPDANFSSADNESAVIRLNTNGTLDTTYATNGILRFGFGSAHCQANNIAIQPDNKVVVAGYSTTTSSDHDFAVARINTDGTLDTDFSNDGKQVINLGTYDSANSIAIQPDGKILVAGNAGGNLGLVRFTEYGNLDTTFGTGGKVITNIPDGGELLNTITLQPDGKILGGGYYSSTETNFLVVRYNTNGTLDTTFGTNGYTNVDLDNGSGDIAKSIAQQNDGKIILVGDCYTNGVSYFAIARFTNNGVLDTTFSGDGIQLTTMNGADANAVKLQADGKIVIGGGNYLGGGNTGNFAIARYLGDSYLETPDFENNNYIKIYPNPVQNKLTLVLNDTNTFDNYKIHDLNGRILLQGMANKTTETTIDTETLTPGVYFISFKNSNQTYKIIKK